MKYYITEQAEGGYFKAVMPKMEKPDLFNDDPVAHQNAISMWNDINASLPSVLVHPSFKVKVGDWIEQWKEGWEIGIYGEDWTLTNKDERETWHPDHRRIVLLPPDEEKKDERKPWPFNGYAPGNYMNDCAVCKKTMSNVDKLCFVCFECAVIGAQEILDTLIFPTPSASREEKGEQGYNASDIGYVKQNKYGFWYSFRFNEEIDPSKYNEIIQAIRSVVN